MDRHEQSGRFTFDNHDVRWSSQWLGEVTVYSIVIEADGVDAYGAYVVVGGYSLDEDVIKAAAQHFLNNPEYRIYTYVPTAFIGGSELMSKLHNNDQGT